MTRPIAEASADDIQADDGSLHSARPPAKRGFACDPSLVVDPHAAAGHDGRHALTASRGSRMMGSGDRRPPVLRAGATDAARLPSRIGHCLRWPDGRVTESTS